jgi:putative transposase
LQDPGRDFRTPVLDRQRQTKFPGQYPGIAGDHQAHLQLYRQGAFRAVLLQLPGAIGVLDEETGEYHLYLTDIMPEQLIPEDVALLYRARWSIEMVFKELKRLYKLDEIPSDKPVVIKSLVMVSMLTLVVSHRMLNLMRSLMPEKSERFTPLRWAELFYTSAPDLLKLVLAFEGIELDAFTMLMFYAGEGIDPNVNRERLLAPWVKAITS